MYLEIKAEDHGTARRPLHRTRAPLDILSNDFWVFWFLRRSEAAILQDPCACFLERSWACSEKFAEVVGVRVQTLAGRNAGV